MTIRRLFTCRRTLIAITGIGACVLITWITKVDTSGAVAMIVTAIAGANAAQGVFESKGSTARVNVEPAGSQGVFTSRNGTAENRQEIQVDREGSK